MLTAREALKLSKATTKKNEAYVKKEVSKLLSQLNYLVKEEASYYGCGALSFGEKLEDNVERALIIELETLGYEVDYTTEGLLISWACD